MVNLRRMKRECSFNTNAERNASNGKGLSDSAIFTSYNHTLKTLKPFTVAFNDFNENLDSVADVESWKVCAHTIFLKRIDNVHN